MAGASAAAEASSGARVLLLEREEQPGFHSTGRSAAAYIPSYDYDNLSLRMLTNCSRELLIDPPEYFKTSASMHLVQGIMAALMVREKTGTGQKVDVSLYDSMLAMQMQEAAYWNQHREVLNWAAMPLIGLFETTDGAIVMVGAFKANPLQDICKALQIEDLSVDYPDFASQIKNKKLLQDTFRENFALNSTEYWLAQLEEQDLLCAPVRSLGEALDDPQTAVNNILLKMDHPILGDFTVVGSPVHLSEAPASVRRTPPRLGEHTEEIMREFGLVSGGDSATV